MPYRSTQFRQAIFYHVFNRATGSELLFHTENNYFYSLQLIKGKINESGITISAYCLMPNHFHLLLKPETEANVSLFIQRLCGSYTQALNRAQDRRGSLFSGRFKSVPVLKNSYFLHLVRYIHRNPVEAGLVTTPEDWPYSNYRDIIGIHNGSLHDESIILGRFASPEAYRAFTDQAPLDKLDGFEDFLLED